MIEVAIIAYEGISLFHLSVPVAIFNDAILTDKKLFNVKICSENMSNLTTANGLAVKIEEDTSIIQQADIIIFPSWDPDIAPSDFLIEQIIAAHNRKKLVVGLCLGAYALAYSGILDGKRATTHWNLGSNFAQKFPEIQCDINPLFIDEDNIITSAGSAAAIDCCLYIVKKIYGVKIANKIARMMVSSPERNGGQNQYIENPVLERASDERMAKLVDHVLENMTDNHQLADVAAYCSMSIRSFSRYFKENYGSSFTAWLINARLNYSLALLESTQLSITQVSAQTGFSSEQIFRKHFKQRYDTTPKVWRNLFRNRNDRNSKH